jgi:hypothetical protein
MWRAVSSATPREGKSARSSWSWSGPHSCGHAAAGSREARLRALRGGSGRPRSARAHMVQRSRALGCGPDPAREGGRDTVVSAFPRKRDAPSRSPGFGQGAKRGTRRGSMWQTPLRWCAALRDRFTGTAVRTNVCFGMRDDALSAVTARGQRPRGRGTAADEGNSSKGVNRVAGKGAPAHERWLRPAAGEGASRNAANLVRLRGATNPRPACGANRRGGEKPRGRNESGCVAAHGPNGSGGSGRQCWGVDARQECRRRGTHEDQSHERRIGEGRSGTTEGALKTAPSP